MRFIFEPANEEIFKNQAVNHTLETVVTNSNTGEEITKFERRVTKKWEQTCKNNIETDHRIKVLKKDSNSNNYIVYSRIL